jgi:hypothetical protein
MEKEQKVLPFVRNADKYVELAQKKLEEGDTVGGLSLLFSALECENSYKTISLIAQVYSDLGMFNVSNGYWFKYLNVAPENKLPVAYEQMAINFFYLDNFFASSYYFHQKLSKDGYISKEGLDEEVLNFFYETFDKRSAYHIAYPFDRADWSFAEKMAKNALSSGDYQTAEKLYSKIPEECRSEEISGEYSVSLFLNQKDKQMIEECNRSLLAHGENLTAYCNLSSLYHTKKDKEKSAYYYEQALKLYDNTVEKAYKIATCAMEQQDHLTANGALKLILEERSCDTTMNYFYGLSQINCQDYEGGAKTFCELYRINPHDIVIKFYAQYFSQLAKDENDYKNLLPLQYVKELPAPIVKTYKKKISELYADPKKALTQTKREDVKEILEWALVQDNLEYAKNTVFILCNALSPWAEKLMLDSLMTVEVCGEVKRAIITMLVLSGYKEKFPVIANDFLSVVKPRKLTFEGKIDGDIFVAAYAICTSRMAFWNVDGYDKLAFSINKLYKKLGNAVYLSDVTAEELGAVAICISKLEHFTNVEYVCKFFDVRIEVVKEYLDMLKGEKNDKDN